MYVNLLIVGVVSLLSALRGGIVRVDRYTDDFGHTSSTIKRVKHRKLVIVFLLDDGHVRTDCDNTEQNIKPNIQFKTN